MKTFKDLIIERNASDEDFDDYVDAWHASNSTFSLHEYLGLTKKEYEDIVVNNLLNFCLKLSRNSSTIDFKVLKYRKIEKPPYYYYNKE